MKSWIISGAVALSMLSASAQALFTDFVEAPAVQTDVVTGIPVGRFGGPTETTFDSNGDLLVATFGSGVRRFTQAQLPALWTAGTPISTPRNLHAFAWGLNGFLFAVMPGPFVGDVVQFDLVFETTKTLSIAGMPDGLTVDPKTGLLYLSTHFGDISTIDPTPPFTFRPRFRFVKLGAVSIDQIAWNCDGTQLVANVSPNRVFSIKPDKTFKVLATLPPGTGPDGIAFGRPGTSFEGFVFTNNNNGTMTKIDAVTGAFSLFADSKPADRNRGDMLGVGPDGCMYVSQVDTVVRICPELKPGFEKAGSTLCANLRCATDAVCAGLFSGKQKLCDALKDFVQLVCDKIADEKFTPALNQINAYINKVEAQRGKKNGYTDAEADRMVAVAETLKIQVLAL